MLQSESRFLLATGLRWPERYSALGEIAVGVMLIGVGVWAIFAAVAYLLAFGLGTTVAMTLFAVIAAGAMRAAAERSVRWGRRLSIAVGAEGMAVGAYWIWSALGALTA